MAIKIENLGLLPADRVIIPKSRFSLIQHHGIYLGINANGVHIFAENDFQKGVRMVSSTEFFTNISNITSVKKFNGNNLQRRNSIQKALALKDKPYNLVEFNCEHHSNLIQYNNIESPQLQKGLSIGVFALIVSELYFVD